MARGRAAARGRTANRPADLTGLTAVEKAAQLLLEQQSAIASVPVASVDDAALTTLSPEDEARITLRDVCRRVLNRPQELVTLPGVQPISAMTRYIDGGRDRFIEFVQMAVLNNEPAAVAWWDVYKALPTVTRRVVSFDDVCAGSGVKPRDLMLVVLSAAIDMGVDAANFIAAVAQPKVVHAMTKSAQRIGGTYAETAFKDRMAFLSRPSASFLPMPKGAVQVNVNATANAQAAAVANAEPSVPKFTDDMSALRKALPAGGVSEGVLIAPDADQDGE